MSKKIILLIPTLFTLLSCYSQTSVDYLISGIKKESLQDYEGAIIDYNKAIELDPKKADVYFNRRGFAKRQLKDYRGAIADYSKAIEINPNNTMLIEAMQKETYKITDGAMSDFNKAIRLDPKNENAHFFRGAAKSELKDYRGAIADHSKVIEINPKYADA